MDRLAIFSIAGVTAGLVIAIAPFAAKFSGHAPLAHLFETIIRSPGISIIPAFAIIGWSCIFFAPVQRGELRIASVVGVVALSIFIGAYCLVLFGVLPLGETVTNLMRVAVICGVCRIYSGLRAPQRTCHRAARAQ